MATPFDAKNPALFEVPVPPHEFGQDGGKFYHYYDTLADEIDDDMVAGLKEQLDGLLIFAGLFAGVNSAFLALTLPLMSPDPTDDTNAILRDNNAILLNIMLGRNDSLPTTKGLPSETFSPSGKILTVNLLFSVSLTFALVSSFLAVLGRQWLVYYRKRTGGGPERQRWEQLKRFLGAERWRLEGVLDDVLPSLLQIGLIIFCISLTIYLNTLHPMLSNVVGAFMCAGLGFLLITAILAMCDKFCPFQSPLSHFISQVIPLIGFLVRLVLHTILWGFRYIAGALHDCFVNGPRYGNSPWEVDISDDVKDLLDRYLITPITSLSNSVKRKEEGDGSLQITAIRRAICTSDDARTQAHAVSNILSITDADLLVQLATDEEFDARILELCAGSYDRTLQRCGRDRTDLAAATSWVYRAAITHTFLSTASPDQEPRRERWSHIYGRVSSMPSLSLSPDLIHNASSNMIITCLGFVALFTSNDQVRTQSSRLALRSTIDGLVNPSHKCLSMIIEVIMVQWAMHDGYPDEVHAAWIGEASTVHRNLKVLLERCNDPQCPDRDILREDLVDVFNLAGKAAADSGGDSSSRPAMAAGFLRFSEGLVRGRDSPSDLINAGRNLRVELISALQSEWEKLSGKYWEYTSKETLDELIQLFTGLTPVPDPDFHEEETVDLVCHWDSYQVTVGERPTRTLSWDDGELVHLFKPILQPLNTIIIKNARYWDGDPNTEPGYLDFRRQVEELNSIFANFTAAVKCREIKRRNRDSDLQWCYYYE